MADQRTLNIGIDLGTSRSVITCDNGVKTFTPSYVGFPKDAIAKKFFGRDIVFGEEAIEHRMSLELYKPLEKGVLKYSDDPEKNKEGYAKTIYAAKELLKHLIALVKVEDRNKTVIRAVIGAPALAGMQNKQALFEISEGVIDDVMIVSEPFAVAYGLNILTNALVIDIGAGSVDLCRMHATIPSEEDQITTFKAGDHIDEMLLKSIKDKHKDVNISALMMKRFKEENAIVSEHGEKLFITIPVDGTPVSTDVTKELREACRTIVPDIVEGIKKLIAPLEPEFQEKFKANILLAGGGSQITGLKKEIETYMKGKLGSGKVTKVEDPLYAGAYGALMLCRDMTEEQWRELKNEAEDNQTVT